MLGQMMGCVIRQRMIAYPGLSKVFKAVLADKDVFTIDLTTADISNLELRTVLEKVSDPASNSVVLREEYQRGS